MGSLVACGRVRGLHEELVQPRTDAACVEVTVKSVGCGARRLQPRRLAVEQVEQDRGCLGRVIKGPEPGLDAIVAELRDGPMAPATMGRPAAIASMIASDDVSEYEAWT